MTLVLARNKETLTYSKKDACYSGKILLYLGHDNLILCGTGYTLRVAMEHFLQG
jgi:hypothetical protein